MPVQCAIVLSQKQNMLAWNASVYFLKNGRYLPGR